MRTLITPPGIGDILWVIMKLINTGEKFHIRMSEALPQRGHQLLDLLPDIIASHEYKGIIKYKDVNDRNITNSKKRWAFIGQDEFYISANRHLELGQRIEKWLPDLPTTYVLPYKTSDDDKIEAEILLPEGQKYIGIYTSAYSNARNWQAWTAKEWFEFIKLLKGKNRTFVIIGAGYDIGVTDDLMKTMDEQKIKYINTIGTKLSVVVEILKRCVYFAGFPSGLSIINETLGKDGLMFYSKQIQGIINTWADPVRIKEGNIKECLFTEPGKVYEWLKNEYKINDKI